MEELTALMIVLGAIVYTFKIAYYDVMLQKKEHNESFKGFWADVLWPITAAGGKHNHLPYFMLTKYADQEMERLRKRRNLWVLIFWLNLVGMIIFVLIVSKSSTASENSSFLFK